MAASSSSAPSVDPSFGLEEVRYYDIRHAYLAPLLGHLRHIHYGYQPFTCGHCDGVFPNLYTITDHNDICHGGQWKIISRKNPDIEAKMEADIERILTANIALQDGANTEEDLLQRMGIEGGFVFCPDCQLKVEFSNKDCGRLRITKYGSLVSHISRIFYGYQPYVCEHCLARFPTIMDIERHTEYAHHGEWKMSSVRDFAIEKRINDEMERQLAGLAGNIHPTGNDNANHPAAMPQKTTEGVQNNPLQTSTPNERSMRPKRMVKSKYGKESSPAAQLPRSMTEEVINEALDQSVRSELSQRRKMQSKWGVAKGTPARPVFKVYKVKGVKGRAGPPKNDTSNSLVNNIMNSSRLAKYVDACFGEDTLVGVEFLKNYNQQVQCPYCPRTFAGRALANHLRRIHRAIATDNHHVRSCKLCGSFILDTCTQAHANYCAKFSMNRSPQKRRTDELVGNTMNDEPEGLDNLDALEFSGVTDALPVMSSGSLDTDEALPVMSSAGAFVVNGAVGRGTRMKEHSDQSPFSVHPMEEEDSSSPSPVFHREVKVEGREIAE